MLGSPSESVNLPVPGSFPDSIANPEFCQFVVNASPLCAPYGNPVVQRNRPDNCQPPSNPQSVWTIPETVVKAVFRGRSTLEDKELPHTKAARGGSPGTSVLTTFGPLTPTRL